MDIEDSHEIFNPRFSNGFVKEDLINIFKSSHKKVKIKKELLDKLKIVFNESHSYYFNSYKTFNKFMYKMRKKLKYDVIVSKPTLYKYYRNLLKNNEINQI